MAKPKYEVGDKFRNPRGVVHMVYGVLESVDGGTHYWVDDNGDRDPWTATEWHVEEWEKIEPFFEEGVTYAWRSAVESSTAYDTWKVIKIYELDGAKHVWALFTHASGDVYMTAMSTDNYDRMVEVGRDLQ